MFLCHLKIHFPAEPRWPERWFCLDQWVQTASSHTAKGLKVLIKCKCWDTLKFERLRILHWGTCTAEAFALLVAAMSTKSPLFRKLCKGITDIQWIVTLFPSFPPFPLKLLCYLTHGWRLAIANKLKACSTGRWAREDKCPLWHDSGRSASLSKVHTHKPNTADSLQTARRAATDTGEECAL